MSRSGVERAQLVDHALHRVLLVQRRARSRAAKLRELGGADAGAGSVDVSGTGNHRHAAARAARAAAARGAHTCARRARARARVVPSPPPAPGSASSSRYAATASSASETTTSSRPGSNQRSIPSCGFETIAAPHAASSNGRHVDDAGTVACALRVMLRLMRAARDRAREDIERDVADHPRRPDVAAEVAARRARSRAPAACRLGSPTSSRIHSRLNLSP